MWEDLAYGTFRMKDLTIYAEKPYKNLIIKDFYYIFEFTINSFWINGPDL